MSLEQHSELKGTHALLSPSSYGWRNYTSDEQLISRLKSSYAQTIGTLTHELAADHIKKRRPLDKKDSKLLQWYLEDHRVPSVIIDLDELYPNFRKYVNDSISLRMLPEQLLYFSDYCYGTVDAYCFKKGNLRIHDLKTGKLQAKMDQLEIYAGLFCLQNGIKPETINFDLRIYQYGDVNVYTPTSSDIQLVIDDIVAKDKFVSNYISGGSNYD